ncbi:tail fiber domain-containing protein [Haliscomenobacter hydrossis]|uniref:Peptidase S74 domain-containing protein n=1 Tax=Haliscomenobacter hydrossis (strain ATCC 27775 / DSM 1100 / LMG 10767 / O) TaxID=760192 RepID=F4KPY3_HALH1|nr:tail fiber domain-containing protein [Haliscomenobacter hydrossis]AEE53187.1 hypothetical protein Halhy_5362 [Haliscomenobacter hydrossis DSM 1100]
MKHFSALLFSMFVLVIVGYSQARVETNGKVRLGNTRPTNDPLNEVTHEILGLGTDENRVGSKLSFGDYGRASLLGANVYVGEFGTTDTDRLELGGKNGFHFMVGGDRVTNGMAFQWVAGSTNAWVFDIWGQVRSYGITLTSDIRLKSNVKKIDNGLTLVKQLNGISYDFNKPISAERIKLLADAVPNSEKERQEIEKERNKLAEESKPQKDQLGFSAQDVQKILPQLVTQDEQGMLSVNYIGMIPVLVEAIKEQQTTIEAMKKEIELLKKK